MKIKLNLYDINEEQYDEIKDFIESKKVKYEGVFLSDPINIKTNDDSILNITLNHDSILNMNLARKLVFDKLKNGDICVEGDMIYVAIENINQKSRYNNIKCSHKLNGKFNLQKIDDQYSRCQLCGQKFKNHMKTYYLMMK